MKKIKRKKVIKAFIIFLIVYLVVIASLLVSDLLRDDVLLSLKGEDEVTISLGEEFVDLGYEVFAKNKDKTYTVVIDNTVNNKKIGKYEVTYKLDNKKKIRIVNVVDDIAPVIELKGKEEVYVCEGMKYQEDGYFATDNYDQDVNSKTVVTIANDFIIYSVVDSSGNETKRVRKIIYDDIEAPEFTFDKEGKLYVYQGATFKDSYKVIDNCDGDITNKVKVTGAVDTSKIGEYILKYEVNDTKGNKRTITRTVVVREKPKNKSIYLTFDDGPSNDVTPKILDLLKEYNIKATFFVINHDSSTDKVMKRAYEEGHTIGIHSYTHKYSKIYQSDDAYFEDLAKIEKKVISVTGKSPKIIRFPGGSSNTVSKAYNKGIMTRLTKEVEKRGYVYQDWNVGSLDTETQNPDKICKNVINNLGNNYNIVLMHDFAGHKGTYEALPCIINYALDNGYTFYALDVNSPVSHHRILN